MDSTEHFLELRRQKEVIKMYEANKNDWRSQLNEEHPYVEVMPKQTPSIAELAKKLKQNNAKKPSQGTEVNTEIPQ